MGAHQEVSADWNPIGEVLSFLLGNMVGNGLLSLNLTNTVRIRRRVFCFL
jgi:hypothetical protein